MSWTTHCPESLPDLLVYSDNRQQIIHEKPQLLSFRLGYKTGGQSSVLFKIFMVKDLSWLYVKCQI